jgi:hypothetical protein
MFINDTGHFSTTRVSTIIKISKEQHLAEMRSAIQMAKEKGVPISVCGARHTQGGHIASPDGIVLDLSELNEIKFINKNSVRIQSGATWRQVLEFLHPHGWSVDIMQSDDDFTIGGTVSANVHGWQANKPPISSSITRFHILTADGTVRSCSRQEHADLFQATLGGYGLLGIILDVDIVLVENNIYKLQQERISIQDFIPYFTTRVQSNKKAAMFLGHFSLSKKHFLKNILFLVYEDTGTLSSLSPLPQKNLFKTIKWWLFTKTHQSEAFKAVRNIIEKIFIDGAFSPISRNALLYRSLTDYFNRDHTYVDLLQEYFVPVQKFEHFVRFLQSMHQDLSGCLLNMTARHVQKDHDTVLNFASQEVIAFVMYFRGKRTREFDDYLGSLARKMAEYALELGGSYYLPYRPYQTKTQFEKAYPRYQEFLRIKALYDPEKLFLNNFGRSYMIFI